MERKRLVCSDIRMHTSLDQPIAGCGYICNACKNQKKFKMDGTKCSRRNLTSDHFMRFVPEDRDFMIPNAEFQKDFAEICTKFEIKPLDSMEPSMIDIVVSHMFYMQASEFKRSKEWQDGETRLEYLQRLLRAEKTKLKTLNLLNKEEIERLFFESRIYYDTLNSCEKCILNLEQDIEKLKEEEKNEKEMMDASIEISKRIKGIK